VDHILTRTLLPELSAEFLARMADDQPINAVKVSLDSEGAFRYAFT
jgi:type VI secretion system protein VasG